MNVNGITLRSPPICRMSKVLVAWLTLPDPRNKSALKKAWFIRWKMAATYAPDPSESIM